MKKHFNKKFLFFSVSALILSLLLLCSCNFDLSAGNTYNSITASENKDLQVHFLDVGQGDSIFIELPSGKTMLIDAGENYCGEGIIEYINDCGYSKIDYLVATHPHADHIGSMAYIVRNTDIGSVYMPKAASNTKAYENLLESILDKGLKITSIKSGLKIADEADYKIQAVAPVEIDNGNINNSSAVIKINYKNNSFLFLGDAETKEIQTIYDDISADVLKVGHHGSDTSTSEELLNAVNPGYAVISVGKKNDYYHPHKNTLKLLKEYNCEVFRTDKDKTVIIKSDGNNITAESGIKSIRRAK